MGIFNIWPEDLVSVNMSSYLLDDNQEHGVVLILPGGSYAEHAEHEGMCIAQCFNELGFHAFVLKYRVAPNRYPMPQQDILRAIKFIRSRAGEFKIISDKIAVLGFSAGGHLAACSGTLYDKVDCNVNDSIDNFSAKPNALILCYGVISFGEFGHKSSAQNLFGENFEQHIEEFSMENCVTQDTPPTFLWHTMEDSVVPYQNSILFTQAMHEKKRPVELHLFPTGHHGIGLASSFSDAKAWPSLAANFLRKTGKFP